MLSSSPPIAVPLPFANSGTKNTIPTASQIGITPGAASLTDGFPPLTFTPISAGGVPPFGADFNGILNMLSQTVRWVQAGGGFVYGSTFATNVSGYPKGALLLRSSLDGFWLNQTDGNTSDPDASGAGWTDPFEGRLIGVQTFNASGTYTPTPGTKSVVVEVVGGGGAGGGTAACAAGQSAAAAGGGAGGFAKSRITSGFSGVAVTVGAGGTPTSASAGGNGGTSSFGALLSAPGGTGGTADAATSSFPHVSGYGNGGAIGVGGNIFNATGGAGSSGFGVSSSNVISGSGGASYYGGGANASISTSANGNAASSPGSGGSGSTTISSGAAKSGGAGASGMVTVYEYA